MNIGDVFRLDDEWFELAPKLPRSAHSAGPCRGCAAEHDADLCESLPTCGTETVHEGGRTQHFDGIFLRAYLPRSFKLPAIGSKWTAPAGTVVEFAGFQHDAAGEKYLFTEPTIGILRVTSLEGFTPKRGA